MDERNDKPHGWDQLRELFPHLPKWGEKPEPEPARPPVPRAIRRANRLRRARERLLRRSVKAKLRNRAGACLRLARVERRLKQVGAA